MIHQLWAGFLEGLRLLGAFVEALFEDHRLVRRALVVFALYEIHVVIQDFLRREGVDSATASVYIAVIGILATVTAFYIRSRELDK